MEILTKLFVINTWILLGCVVVLVVLSLLQLLLKANIRKHARRAAERILKNSEVLLVEKFETVKASPDDFPWLDIAFYDTTAEWMKRSGFNHIGDVEIPAATKFHPEARTFVRSFLHDDATVCADCYHLLNRNVKSPVVAETGGSLQDQRVCEFMTVFPDDIFLRTTNAQGSNALNSVPNVRTKFMPAHFTPDVLYKLHGISVREYADKNGVKPVSMQSAEDVRAQMDREQAIKARYRKQNGAMSGDEVRRMISKHPQFAEMVAQEVDKLRAASK